jgi:hypothetical protein
VKIGWHLENAVVVQAPAWLVWQILLDVLRWPSARSLDMRGGPSGAPGLPRQFSYTLNPLGLPIRVKARLETARTMQYLSWQGRFWGITSQVQVRLAVEGDNQTRITFQEKLHGAGLIWFSALFSMERLVKFNQKWLNGLSREMEARARQLGAAGSNPTA